MTEKNNMNAFEAVRKAYTELREAQRCRMIDFLNKNGFTNFKGDNIAYKGGSGRPDYTNGGQIKPFDLSNWKYIDAYRGETYFFISLQAYDRDKNSGNYHVLMDRVGICAFPVGSKNAKYDYFNNMKTTSLDLPLSDDDLKYLLTELNEIEEEIKLNKTFI